MIYRLNSKTASRSTCVQDVAEVLAQLAMSESSREALLKDATVIEALHQVATDGWTKEARMSADSALLALSGRQPDEHHVEHDQHVMISYQWDVQGLVKRIVEELQIRDYRMWFGA